MDMSISSGNDLTVTADGKVGWQGPLASEAALTVGPPGFRTDNARITFEYFASAPTRSGPPAQQVPLGQGQCVISEGD
jgi:hypothetical protein